jgi:hypothetical protein
LIFLYESKRSTMKKHPHFDLLLHENSELERYINGSIYQRTTLHEWPLSCVQKIVHYDARRYIYKAQSGPTVEAEFYAVARSKLLVGARTLYREGLYTCLLLEHLEAPELEDLGLREEEALRAGKEILDEISRITCKPPGRLPVYLDVHSTRKWVALVKETLAMLEDLVDQGTFVQIDHSMIERVRAGALGEPVRSMFDGPTGLVHGDLGGDNVFLLADGYRVIDWQRPVLGPAWLDLATLLESLGYDPAPHVGKAVHQALSFLHLRWWVECAGRWYPPAHSTYDRLSAEIIRGTFPML